MDKYDGVSLPGADNENHKFIVGNWKCHKDINDAKKWLNIFASHYKPSDNVTVVIAPTFLSLEGVSEYLKSLCLENVFLAAQDVSPFPRGSYTGAISADMLKGIVDFVLVGHSERRRYFHETSQNVTNKILEATDEGIIPIISVETAYAMSQLAVLNELDTKNVIVGYGPVDALNFKIPELPEKVEEVVQFITEIHPKVPVIYGGCLHVDNVEKYLAIDGLSGLFVGSESLDAKKFATICNAVTSSL